MAKKKQNIVVVGGGFGGIKTAEMLSKNENFKVTLISERDDFWYFPRMYHTATGAPSQLSSIPLEGLFKNYVVKIIIAKASKVNRLAKEIVLDNKMHIKYDQLILALGVVTNYFGIDGLEKFSYGIKSIHEVEELKAHLHAQLIDEGRPDFNYLVVGGGPTGIELAGQLPGYLRKIMKDHAIKDRNIHVSLIEAAPRLLPRMSRHVGQSIKKQLRKLGVQVRTNKQVAGATADTLMIGDKPLKSRSIIWTAGQANNPFFSENDFSIGEHHKVVVNEYLEAEPDIFVIGDNAETLYSGMAQTAIYDAEFVANNFIRVADGKHRLTYKPKRPIYVIPAGPRWAFVQWGRLHFYGWLGWMLREAGDIKGFMDIETPIQASIQWLHGFEEETTCPLCNKT